MTNSFKILAASFLTLISVSCSTVENTPGLDYESIVRNYSDRVEHYEGLLNVFHMQATMLNSKVMAAQLDKKDKAFSWDATKLNDEKRRVEESLRSETTYFLSFFAPDKKLNDLDRVSSFWKVYLEVNGRRYEAKAVKFLGSVEELKLYYPYHNDFAFAYKLTFPTSGLESEKSATKVTLTGPLGSRILNFKAIE